MESSVRLADPARQEAEYRLSQLVPCFMGLVRVLSRDIGAKG